MKLIITGASGMVGSEVVRQALLQSEIEEITVIVRNPLAIVDAKLKTIIHTDFLDYTPLKEVFANNDACAWCLGVPQAWVTKEEYHTITYSYTLAAAEFMLSVNKNITFLFVSGDGADSKEKSRITFAREKGKTENALIRMSFKNLIIVRPGGIQPIIKPKKAPLSYKIIYPLYPVLKYIIPNKVITSVELAKAILHLLKNGSDKVILENKDLKNIIRY